MSPCSKDCTDPDVERNLMEGGGDPETEKYAEFMPSRLLSLKFKVTSIMVELDPEKMLAGKTVGFPFALTFPLQTLNSPGGAVQEGNQAAGTDSAAGTVVKDPMVSLPDTEKSYMLSF